MLMIGLALLMQAQTAPRYAFDEPPVAQEPEGPIETVLLSPVFRDPFMCGEHPAGEETMAGDALGTDCQILGGVVEKDRSFGRLYRTDGSQNEDWYSWGAEVLAPVDGVIVGLLPSMTVNVPGKKGRPPAGMIQFRADDGTLVTYGHVMEFKVALGDRVNAGQPVAEVGNNGPSYAPHVHIGAARGAVPLQIRWNQRAMARLKSAN